MLKSKASMKPTMNVHQRLIRKNLFAEKMSFQRMFGCHSAEHLIPQMLATKLDTILPVVSLESHRSVIHTKESDGIDDPNEKIAMKSHIIGIILIPESAKCSRLLYHIIAIQ